MPVPLAPAMMKANVSYSSRLRVLGFLASCMGGFSVAWGSTHEARAGELRLDPVTIRSENLERRLVGPPELEPPLRKQAVLFGSSSFAQSFGRIIEADLKAEGYEIARKALVSAGFARPDFKDIAKIAEDIPVGAQTDTVVLYFGMNDAQSIWLRPDERRGSKRPWLYWRNKRWSDVYRKRVTQFVDSLCARGASSVVVLLPIDVAQPRLERRLGRIRTLLSEGAGDSQCGTAVPTTGDMGRFQLKTAKRRRLSDGVHMTRRGAKLIWHRLRDHVLQSLDRRKAGSASG